MLSIYSKLSPQIQTECPRLRAVMHVAMSLKFNSAPGRSDASRVLLEGLFAHFFSSERGNYHSNDIRWFLELANCQKDWGSDKLEEKRVTQLEKPNITEVRTYLLRVFIPRCAHA